MPFFECSVDIKSTITCEITAADRYEAAAAFRKLHGHQPDYVGDDAVIGACEGCEKAIFEGDDYSADEEGIRVCFACCPPEELARAVMGAYEGDSECSTPSPPTDALLRARYQFPAEPMKNLSIGDLTDLIVAYVAGEMSEGLLSQMTGLDRMVLRGLHQDAITRSDRLCESYREEEESRFQASLVSSKSALSDSGSNSTTEKPC